MTMPSVLTIAESDPSGGAGIQADLKTFTALNCHGASVVTALTVQNTKCARGVHPCTPQSVKDQLEFVLDNTDVLAVKTGMLDDEETIRVVASVLKQLGKRKTFTLVLDPECESTSGHALLANNALGCLIDEILPLATLITPNVFEAERILSYKGQTITITSLADIISASKELLTLGKKAVLLKGGHVTTTMTEVQKLLGQDPAISVYKCGLLDENMNILQVGISDEDRAPKLVVDVLQDQNGPDGQAQTSIFIRPKVEPASTRGTGSTLSAAITCGLANGLTTLEAVRNGTTYTHLGILHAPSDGTGHSPLNHTYSLVSRFVPRPCPGDKFPLTRALISSTAKMWKEYVEHPFVKDLGKGVLDRKCFLHFIKQDYHYLRYYARAFALMAAKSTSFAAITAATRGVEGVLQEVTKNHMEFCARYGISEEELEQTPESTATTAYGAYILDIGFQSDTIKLNMALAACLLGYGEVGLWLIHESKLPDSWVVMDENLNPYVPWIKVYSSKSYQSAVVTGLATMEGIEAVTPITEKRFQELNEIWTKCVMLERGFWNMAMDLS